MIKGSRASTLQACHKNGSEWSKSECIRSSFLLQRLLSANHRISARLPDLFDRYLSSSEKVLVTEQLLMQAKMCQDMQVSFGGAYPGNRTLVFSSGFAPTPDANF